MNIGEIVAVTEFEEIEETVAPEEEQVETPQEEEVAIGV